MTRHKGMKPLAACSVWSPHLRLDPRSQSLPELDYTNGTLRNVRWNSTSDYRLLYPYILADSIGGDLKQEQYHFYGGYTRMDGRFNYGITAGYRASQAYRQVDPRPRNITAELSADLSAGYRSGTYVLGVAGGIRTYKQQQSVDFYDPNGANTSELHFTDWHVLPPLLRYLVHRYAVSRYGLSRRADAGTP